ncbi:homocysteine biosynthesis protein [Methanomassiliicoccus luminyensis]|uniref:homocysteine biosynthesis protein n=1 Tax=Methanomassiliicoccus luminyensis TaxID=1080712 RepID=UPI000368E8D4|nr:homocysteine biosynthesis protein [Methanomassiliicoccus luminyensis]
MLRTYEEINAKIAKGDAVVLTAEEAIRLVEEKGVEKAAKEVDVVTTGTFGAMCSSGAFINFGHSEPPIKMSKVWLNDVPAYTGLAAVDAYIGATELKEDMKLDYGGAHVIESLIKGEAVHLRATAYGTDCYPRKDIDTYISLKTVNQAYMYNPRNMYQNYGVATNSSEKTLYTYMGELLPSYGNVTYSSAGQLSPLLKDPQLRTIGMGTRIFLGGGIGYVAWEGTQYKTNVPVRNGVPASSARALAVIGDLNGMSDEFVRALSFTGYGTTLGIGIGVPIPILDEDLMRSASITDDKIFAPVLDYSIQSRNRKPMAEVSYAELRSGHVDLFGKKVKTSSLSSYYKARIIADKLKKMIADREFTLTPPVEVLPKERVQKPLDVRSREEVL